MGLPFFPCSECGKVCKSTRGLRQHSSVHRQPGQLENPIQGFHRECHPLLNGIFLHPSVIVSLCSRIFKEHHVIIMAIFSHRKHHQRHHHRSRTTTGPHSHRGKGSSLPKFYTSRLISRKVLSTSFLTFGVLRSFLTTTSPPSLVTRISTPRLMRSDWETSHGDHTPPAISGSVPTLAQYPSG